MTNFHKTSTFLNFHKSIYTVQEAALLLGKSDQTIYRWCESGKLLAKGERYGSKVTYRISKDALQLFIQQQEQDQTLKKSKNKAVEVEQNVSQVAQKDLVEAFRTDCLNGLIPGAKKRFSKRTTDHYCDLLNKFFQSYDTVNYSNLKARLADIEAERLAKQQKEPTKKHPDMIESKNKLIKACICFAKYLEQSQTGELVKDLNRIKIQKKEKSQIKRTTITADELERMLAVCETTKDKLLIMFLATTGLRASEYCDLVFGDIDLEERIVTIQNGKGGKQRQVVMSTELVHLIQCYLVGSPLKKTDYFHTNRKGEQMNKDGVYKRVQRIGNLAGVEAASHALRRGFVTINANKGRPLHILQKACGHERIQTTMAYCQTTEEEFIQNMKEWG